MAPEGDDTNKRMEPLTMKREDGNTVTKKTVEVALEPQRLSDNTEEIIERKHGDKGTSGT